MRSQARWDHRPPDPVDPPDDWVNGSWTVDCVCGVNFDDGEEMVNCDECGVWVHTRCSRYVKSEKSFACDKCKSSKNKKDCDNDRIEEEEAETEVAQLLVDLPTKTLRRSLGNPIPSHGFRRRLWTEIPMEEKVHVQGVPGGDIGLFSSTGLSSVFGPELWKCTGYVPKKFNFQYKEFACWNEGNEHPATNGDANANAVVMSLSKDKVVIPTDSEGLGAGPKTQVEESKKKEEGEDVDGRIVQHNGMKKDKSSVHPTMIHYGKRKKEDLQTSKDVSGKKKARVVHVEGEDSKKRGPHTSRSASILSSDAKLSERRGSRIVESGKHKKLKGNMPDEPSLKHVQGVEVDDPKISRVLSTHGISLVPRQKDEYGLTASFQNSSKSSDNIRLLQDHDESGNLPANAEDVVAVDNVSQCGRVVSKSDRIKIEHSVKSLDTVAPQVIDSQDDQDSNGKMSLSCLNQNRAQVDINDSGGILLVRLSSCDGKLDDAGLGSLPQHNDRVLTKVEGIDNVQSIDHKVVDIDKNTVDADCQIDKAEGVPSAPVLSQCDRHLVGSDSSQVAMENSEELKEVRHTEEQLESCETTLISSEELTKRKMAVSFGKSSSTTLLSKCLTSDGRRSVDAQNFNGSIKQNVVSENRTICKKDNSSTGFAKDRERYEKPKKIAKELPKSSTSSVKTSNPSKVPVSFISTKIMSESKESSGLSSAKPSLAQNVANPMTDESPSSFQLEGASYVDNKTTTSSLMQRPETVNHGSSQPLSKANHAPQMHHSAASNTPATLSDEELALLLHHELNSSPRVPRVPRMRHAGNLPQLASPTGANLLMKRSSSSSVGKDHGLVFKRKGKSIAKEEAQNSHELQDESKDVKRSSLLPFQRTNDSARKAGFVTKRETDYGSAQGEQSVNKSIPRATTLTVRSASSAASEGSEPNVPCTFKSAQIASDDDTGTDVRPTHRTLPGLLSEIMSKRMTYEELCNAVLPHWPFLRKHNGERYAYSSHSQAVLDCLRNRSEWARLVDRGPKTNAGRKRRRSDAEAPSFESEDNKGNTKNAKGVVCISAESEKAQFPKGKRKTRKRRRRLSLQGRGLKNMVLSRGRRQKKADDASYDEDKCSLSSSSSAGESSMSEDEKVQEGGGTSSAAGRSEASASSE